MKHPSLFFRFCGILLSITLLFCSLPLPSAADEPQYYLALGDSISTGYCLGGSHFEDERFTKILAETNGYVEINEAIDGNTMSGILSQLEDGSLDEAIASADLITITCGGNDMLEFLYSYLSEQLETIQWFVDDILIGILRDLDILPSSESDTAEEPPQDAPDADIPPENSADPEAEPEEPESEEDPLDSAYRMLEDFIIGINQSLRHIEEAREDASLWENILFIAYEELIDYALDTAVSLLIDITESDQYREAVSSYITNLNLVISHIRSINRDAQILLTTQYNPYHWFTSPAHEVIDRFIDEGVCVLNDAIIRNAPVGGYWVTDVYSAFDNSETNLCNAEETPLEMDVHPNKDGHAAIASCIQETIEITKKNSIN